MHRETLCFSFNLVSLTSFFLLFLFFFGGQQNKDRELAMKWSEDIHLLPLSFCVSSRRSPLPTLNIYATHKVQTTSHLVGSSYQLLC